MAADQSTGVRTHSWWQALVRGSADHADRLIVVSSGRHPDGARVELDAAAARRHAGDDVVCEAVIGTVGVEALHVSRSFAPRAPDLWFVELTEPTAQPDAVNLVAFSGAGQQPGALLDEDRAAASPVTSGDQLGAIRWYPGTGEVDQVYVAPAWRRHQVGTALIGAAGTLSVARGWPRLWGDGQRTADGEGLRNARSWRDRTADLTHLAPPMTPPTP